MAIAANFRKYAQAMALQLVLPLSRPKWNGARPSTKLGRATRAFVTASMKARGTVEYLQPRPVPQWWKAAQQRARDFSLAVRAACKSLDFYREENPHDCMTDKNACGFSCFENNYLMSFH